MVESESHLVDATLSTKSILGTSPAGGGTPELITRGRAGTEPRRIGAWAAAAKAVGRHATLALVLGLMGGHLAMAIETRGFHLMQCEDSECGLLQDMTRVLIL